MKKILTLLTLLTTTALLTGCGGGSSTETPTAAVSGHVSGTYGVEESIGVGATVNLIQIDTQGNQVGSVIVTTSTDVSGNYTLNIPTTYSASTNYTITASDGTNTISAIWTGSTTDVNVITDAATTLLFNTSSPASSSLASFAAATTTGITIAEVENTIDVVTDMSENSTDLVQNVQEDQEALDQVDSAWGGYTIKGKVTDSDGAAIQGIKVFARDFNNHEKRSSIKTDADGNYEMNIKLKTGYGDKMIVGVMNRTTASLAASEFYTDASPATGSGAKCFKPHCGKSITISETTPQVTNFQLAAGSRITGTITGGANNTKLKRVKIRFRDSVSRRFRGAVRTNDDGDFNFNISPGSYIAYISNDTNQQYASTAWTSNGGHVDRNYGEIFTVAAGGTKDLDINLAEGGTIQGIVCNSGTGTTCVESSDHQFKKIKIRKFSATDRFSNNIEFDTDTVRSNSKSKFKLQVPYGKYRVFANGKNYNNDDAYYTIDANTKTLRLDINHTTSTVKVKVVDANGDPLSDVGVGFRNYVSGDKTGTSTFADGSAQAEVDTTDSSKFYIGLTSRGGESIAACNYDGTDCSTTALNGRKENNTDSTGKALNNDKLGYTHDIAANPGVLTLTMPAGFVVTGTVTGTDGSASANASVFYDVLDTLKDNITTGWSNLAGGSTGADGAYSMSLAGSVNYLFKSKLDDDTRIEFRGAYNTTTNKGEGCSISEDSTKDFNYTNASSKARYRFYDCEFETPAMPHTITGVVKKKDGSVLAKALVRVDIKTTSGDVTYRRIEAITADDGTYSVKVPEDLNTYYYKAKAYYDLSYGETDFWVGPNNKKYIEYGKNKNCTTAANHTSNSIVIDFDAANVLTADWNSEGGKAARYVTCTS